MFVESKSDMHSKINSKIICIILNTYNILKSNYLFMYKYVVLYLIVYSNLIPNLIWTKNLKLIMIILISKI